VAVLNLSDEKTHTFLSGIAAINQKTGAANNHRDNSSVSISNDAPIKLSKPAITSDESISQNM